MVRIVLNEEPTCTMECPFYDKTQIFCTLNRLQKYGGDCVAIRKIPNEFGAMVNATAFDEGERVTPIDFERCPYCTTFDKEYIKVLREGEI